jgi:hypothetical protein
MFTFLEGKYMKIKNKDLICMGGVIVFLIVIYAIMKKNPSEGDRKSPLPINQYTSGAISNPMDVKSRVNFQQQPVGGNFS